jgi:hypothetical protein
LGDAPQLTHQGFILFPQNYLEKADANKAAEFNDVMNVKLPNLFETEPEYVRRCFRPIFEIAQARKRRFGEKKRMQAKLSDLIQYARVRIQRAELAASREQTTTKRAEKWKVLNERRRERELLVRAARLMSWNYGCMQQVRPLCRFCCCSPLISCGLQIWPQNIPEQVSVEKLAIILSKPDAPGQGFHQDSRAPGCSLLTAQGQDQHVMILWNSYRATRILEKLTLDRQTATDFVRRRLATDSPTAVYSDEKWRDSIEPRVWRCLVDKEFEARGVGPFEAVLVTVKMGQTIAIDNRCVHAGAPWKGPGRAFRGHAYGYVPNLELRDDADYGFLDKDHETTVDILAGKMAPIGWRAQQQGLFRCR